MRSVPPSLRRKRPRAPERDRAAERGGPKLSPAPPRRHANAKSAAGNQAIQRQLAWHGIRAKLTISHPGDPQEREADRVADAVAAQQQAPAIQPGRASPNGARDPRALQRKGHHAARPAMHAAERAASAVGSGGEALPRPVRGEFERYLGRDLGEVRVHTSATAADAARSIHARAYTRGRDIAFAPGEYAPTTQAGRRLLAHELTHVVQQRESDASTLPLQRDGADQCSADAPVCEQPIGPQVCEASDSPAEQDLAHPTAITLTGTLDERIAAFKQLVKTTAIHRLISNQRNLSLWETLVESRLPDSSLAATGLLQSGGYRAYAEMQDIASPTIRWLRAQQAIGRDRACTGCHIEKDARAREAGMPHIGREWLSPNQARAGAPTPGFALFGGSFATPPAFNFPLHPSGDSGYTPPAGTAEGMLNTLLPDPTTVLASMERVRPILEALGPQGYAVLPGSILGDLEHGSVANLRAEIAAAIEQRKSDYGELIGKIRSGDVGYEHFGPIITDLLPLADHEVATAIRAEMDSHAFWSTVEAVVVGVLTVAALLLTIFPPTSVLGVAALGALDIGLASYGAVRGAEMFDTGRTYSLALGADDVFSRSQQEAGPGMMLMGFVSVVTAPLAMASGVSRLETAAAAFMGSSMRTMTALAQVGQTVQRGDFLITLAEDGSLTANSISRPDMLIILRGNTATLYQSLGSGGMRALATAEIPLAADSATSATALLGAGPTPPLPVAGEGGGMPPLLTAGDGASAASRALPPGPAAPLQLGPGNPTTYTWQQISNMRQPALWTEREIYMQQLYGATGQQHFPVPGTGGRFVDVPATGGAGQLFAGEVKSYTRWITAEGQAQRNFVGLSERIETQIAREVWLRDNVPGYDPRWIFTDAPPTEELRQALRQARIAFIEHL